jgi:hypothetical protein
MASEVIRCLDAGKTESDLMSLSMSRRMGTVMEEIRAQLMPGGGASPSTEALYWEI